MMDFNLAVPKRPASVGYCQSEDAEALVLHASFTAHDFQYLIF